LAAVLRADGDPDDAWDLVAAENGAAREMELIRRSVFQFHTQKNLVISAICFVAKNAAKTGF
jgi:hypothetical protein